MSSRFISLVSAFVCMTGVAQAQLSPCSTDEHYHRLLQQNPQLAEFEKQFIAQVKPGNFKVTAASDTATYNLPIVVHVVHDYSTENLSDDVIYDAVKRWALTYMKQNSDTSFVIDPFKPWIGNPKIKLKLATKDPSGNPTKGVVRHVSYLTGNAGDQAKYQSWPNNKYLNIWFVRSFDADHAGAAAYSMYPSTAAAIPFYDGVISLSSYATESSPSTKVIPHEIGHYLNLQHVWGSTNEPNVACGDDGVDDTPPTKGHMPGCGPTALYDVTCATGYSRTYMSAAGVMDSVVNYPDTVNSQNIMDYTYCMHMFSKGQATRMRNAMTSSVAGRSNLITAANAAATGFDDPMPDLPPVADFTVNKASGNNPIAEPRSVFLTFNNPGSFVFRNASWNDTISSVLWEFTNAPTTPTSTSTTTVTNRFNVPGWVTVKLTATSNAGSHTIATQPVYAADTAVAGGLGYEQNFASAGDIANWPMFNYYDNQFKWQLYNGGGYDDGSCLRFRSFDTSARRSGTAVGDYDDVYTPAFNLAGISGGLYLNFFTNGASTTTGLSPWTDRVNDSLEIDASNSGGARWAKIGGFRGSVVANAGNKTAEYSTPDATKWVQRGVSIPDAYRTANTFFRIRYRPGNTGNNMYLDKMTISTLPSGVEQAVAGNASFAVYPNPATAGCTLAFKTGKDGVVRYTVTDLAGKVVYSNVKTYAPNSTQEEVISRSVTPAAGMYFITVAVDGVNQTQKLVVY